MFYEKPAFILKLFIIHSKYIQTNHINFNESIEWSD